MFGKLKNVKNVKNVTKIKKRKKRFFTSTRSSVGDRILGIARPGGITAHSLQPSQAKHFQNNSNDMCRIELQALAGI